MNKALRVLMVEDSESDAALVMRELERAGYETDFKRVESASEMRSALEKEIWDLVISDYRMPQFDAPAALDVLHESGLDLPFIVVSGTIGEDLAVSMMKAGAHDYVMKGALTRLGPAIEREIREAASRRERAQALEALQESEERYRSLAESANDAIITMARDGTIVGWNQGARRMFGHDPLEIFGKPVTNIIPGGSLEAFEVDHSRSVVDEFPSRASAALRLQGLRKDGSEFPLELSMSSWETARGRFFTAIVREITDRLQLEERLTRQDRLAAVGQLAAGIAHDFNNIMGAIILYAEMVQKEPGLSDRGSERIGIVLNQAHQATKLTQQILDFSRHSVMEVRPLAMAEFLERFRGLISRTMPESIRVSLHAPEEECLVAADASRLEQAFMNLSINARDAMPDGGHLSFIVSELNLTSTDRPPYPGMQPGDWVRVVVSDTGLGISRGTVTRIFEPFFTTKGPGEGSGLGLAQVYGIVKQHDGFIDVESQPGKGTDFSLFFPRVKLAAPPQEQEDEGQAEVGTGQTILVVEDDAATRQALYEILESLGYRLLVAGDGVEALEVIEKNKDSIDLVLSDMIMPHMGGRALLDLVRERAPHMRMALITGYPLRGGTGELARGVTWIQKPLNSRSLATLIHKALMPPPLSQK